MFEYFINKDSHDFDEKPPVQIRTNAAGLLGVALKNAFLDSDNAKTQNYLNNIELEFGMKLPNNYNATVGFNQPNPVIPGDKLNWQVGLNFPLDI